MLGQRFVAFTPSHCRFGPDLFVRVHIPFLVGILFCFFRSSYFRRLSPPVASVSFAHLLQVRHFPCGYYASSTLARSCCFILFPVGIFILCGYYVSFCLRRSGGRCSSFLRRRYFHCSGAYPCWPRFLLLALSLVLVECCWAVCGPG